MITMTENAKNAIQALTADGPPECGIRIATEPALSANGRNPTVSLQVAAAPEADDQVIDDAGARLFVEPAAAGLIGDQTLDARVDQTSQVSFFVR
jgi:Fe-S cluster assembly iron-binding protein IscA